MKTNGSVTLLKGFQQLFKVVATVAFFCSVKFFYALDYTHFILEHRLMPWRSERYTSSESLVDFGVMFILYVAFILITGKLVEWLKLNFEWNQVGLMTIKLMAYAMVGLSIWL
ncbi:hypothetical protein ACED51_06340 [Photobacterium swingsii]|uniref:hypothetical protein n=1 Tax=Photobacterium swingsii TaxID=680026 RepID=UPI00352F05AC